MRIIDSYIRTHLIRGFVIVMLILVSLFSFLDFVAELDETGVGNYTAFDAFVFVMMTIPERALWLVPISALLGCLIGLSLLDHGNELTVIRTLGVSAKRIVWSVTKTTGLLIFVVILFAQFVSPALGARAWRDRALAIAGDIVLRKDSGTNFWFRDGQRFISVRDMVYGRIPTGIEIYEINAQGELAVFTEAKDAERDTDGVWWLRDVYRKRMNGLKITNERLTELRWDGFLSPKQGAVIELDAESLAPSDLYFYARDLRRRGQNAKRYELTFWRKINIPFATLAMVLIAVPFVFGAAARSGVGARVLIGSSIGVSFFLVDQVIAQLGLLVELNPALAAVGPASVLMLIGAVMVHRLR